MTAHDLDALRQRWSQASRRLDDSLTLDVAQLRAALARRSSDAFRSHRHWLLIGLVLDVAAIAALCWFALAHRADALYLLVSLAMLPLALASFVVNSRQYATLAHLDFSAPVMQLRATFDALRVRRLRFLLWVAMTSVLLWWPLVAVVFKGLFGVDLLRALDPSVFGVTIAVGLACMPLVLLVVRWAGRRYRGRRGFDDFLDDLAGHAWRRARGRVEAQANFERELELDDADTVLARYIAREPSPAIAAARDALRRRLLLLILVNAGLILATGAFNLMHGGQLHFILPGVLLNFAWIAQMVAAILQRGLVGRMDLTSPPHEAAVRLAGILRWGRVIVRRVLALSPLLGLFGLQIVAKVVAGVDLFATAGTTIGTLLLVAVAAGSAWLSLRARRDGERFATRAVERLQLGLAARGRGLIDALEADDGARERRDVAA
jgi:hypothetical protein